MNSSSIVITGASSGIGLSTALKASALGKDLILLSRTNPNICGSLWVKSDFRIDSDIQDACEMIKELKKPLSMLIHCSGVMRSCSSKSLNLKDCTESFLVNVIAPLVITSELTRQLSKGNGKVVAISSIASMLDIPGETIYSSTKAALDQGMNSLSADLSRLGITYLKIHPCMIDTPMTHGLTDNQKNYMHQQRSTKLQPTQEDLAEFILSLEYSTGYITGSDFLFGGMKR